MLSVPLLAFHILSIMCIKSGFIHAEAIMQANEELRPHEQQRPRGGGMGFAPGSLDQRVGGYELIHSFGLPNQDCSQSHLFKPQERFLGRFQSIDECATDARDKGVGAFTYIPDGRFAYFCYEEKLDVTIDTWNTWIADKRAGRTPQCPGGGWIEDEYTYFYAWAPPTPPPTMAPPTMAPLADHGPTMANNALTVPPPRLSATGDPHLVNIRGQRFDIFKAGHHKLLQIPMEAKPSAELLLVIADAVQIGGGCGDMYFTSVNVTGRWVTHKPHQYFAKSKSKGRHERKSGTWRRFGPLGLKGQMGLKVATGHTGDGFPYLNVYVRNLRQVSLPIGGLLGNDDHTQASTPAAYCKRSVSLLAGTLKQTRSVAEATEDWKW